MIVAALLATTVLAFSSPVDAERPNDVFATCAELRRWFPFGIAPDVATARRQPVAPSVLPGIHQKNARLDSDRDGTVCELSSSAPAVRLAIDPALDVDDPTIAAIRRAATDTVVRHRLPRGRVLFLFERTWTGATWALREARRRDCFTDPWFTPDRLLSAVGIASDCGAVLAVLDESWPHVSKDMRTTARHEILHTYQTAAAMVCGCPWPQEWLTEGTADLVAYFDEYGRTSETRRRIVGQLVPIARQTGDVTLEELSRAWTDGSIPTDPRYARAFLAAYLLSRTTSERLVVRGAIDQLLLTGDRDRAFERTFGMTATEFDRRFRQWLAEQ